MKTLSSHPGAGVFRSVVLIVLVTLFALYFLIKTDELSEQTELVAVQRTVAEINIALSLVVYDLAVNKRLDKLTELENQNPFYYLALSQDLPDNYYGVVRKESDVTKNGWFFCLSDQRVIYHSRVNGNYHYRLKFSYSDNNGSGSFEPSGDKITGLLMQKASN